VPVAGLLTEAGAVLLTETAGLLLNEAGEPPSVSFAFVMSRLPWSAGPARLLWSVSSARGA
jgi:hypothetical protein